MRSLLLALLLQPSLSYVAIKPTRYRLQGADPAVTPRPWPVFPADDARQVVAFKEHAVAVGAWEGRDAGPLFLHDDATGGWTNFSVHLNYVVQTQPVLVASDKDLVAAVTEVAVHALSCSLGLAAPRCTAKVVLDAAFGAPLDVAVAEDGGVLWIAAANGLFRAELGASPPKVNRVIETTSLAPMTAVAFRRAVTPLPPCPACTAGCSCVSSSSSEKIWFTDPDSGAVVRWEWVTLVATESGGVTDGATTAMAFSPHPLLKTNLDPGRAGGELIVANRYSLSVRTNDGAFRRWGGDEGVRWGGGDSRSTTNVGLPVSNITAVLPLAVASAGAGGQRAELWLGSRHGVAVFDERADPPWRYLNGPRWLASSDVRSMAATASSKHVFVVGAGGVTKLELINATLADKAEQMKTIQLERHDRHGMTGDCTMKSFGDVKGCLSKDDDNNGLWTSLVVGAFSFAHAVTGAATHRDAASAFFKGMVLLNEVTGIEGLMARSACSPGEIAARTCGTGVPDFKQTCPGDPCWRNSTSDKYKGWQWKSDTSSDEVSGHVFAMSVVARLSSVAEERATAKRLLLSIVRRLCLDNFMLIDWTGKPTRWGRWSPAEVNGFRGFSDERGLQSLQMLAFISAARNVSASAADGQLLDQAFAELTNRTNQYDASMLNAKIEAPGDDNFSDDELTFLPFYTYMTTCSKPEPKRCAPCLAALARSFSIARSERSGLWGAVAAAAGAVPPAELPLVADDVRWNLRTWPAEAIEWSVDNSKRLDLVYQRGANRFGKASTNVIHSRAPLPADERSQTRWNSNPWDVAPSGTGKVEADVGAWLLPYWMARYHGLLSAED